MAYRDGSGAITIDEVAAANDMRRIEEAEGYLAQSRSVIIQLMDLAEGMTGQTADAIRDKAYELQMQVDKLSSQLVESRQLIRATVQRYQRIDAELANSISKQGAGGIAASISKSGHTGTNTYMNQDNVVGIMNSALGGSKSGSGNSGGGGRSF